LNGREVFLSLLGRVRRRALLLGLLRVFLAASAGPLLGVAVLLLFLPLASARAAPWVAGASLGLGLLAGLGLAVWEWRRAKPLQPPPEAVRLLARAGGSAADAIRSGADLATWGQSGAEARGASAELAGAHVDGAAELAAAVDWRAALPARAAAPWALGFGVLLLANGLLAFATPERSATAWRGLWEGQPPPPVLVGNLRVRYEPPAYTGLSATWVEGSSGAVEGLRGSRVTLEGELSDGATAGVWESSDGLRATLEVAGRSFRVSWTLERAGTYGLTFERGGRVLPSDFQPQPVAVREDERPRVELEVPQGDLEVRSDSEVEVRFSASDDFRVDRAEIVLQGEGEVRLPLRITPGPVVTGSGRFLPLGHPKLGGGAELRVEAWDSDTVSGPKAGSSRSIYVSFLDKRKLMAEVEGLEARLLEAILSHLADHLELPAPKAAELDKLRAGGSDLLKLFEVLVARVKQGAENGALGALAVLRLEDGLRSALQPFLSGREEREGLVSELERDALFLERLLQNLRMEETLNVGEELTALQRSLFDELQAGGSTQDLLSRVDHLEQLLSRMLERLSRGSSEMPDAFANSDAARDAPAGELEQLIEKLRDALRAGDRERAKKLAEELLQTLSRWMKALEEAADEAAGGETDPILRELAKLEAEVRQMTEDQERILRETRAAGEEAARRAAETQRAELRSFLERQEQRLNRISELARRTEALAPRPGLPPTLPVPPPPSLSSELFQSSQRVDAAVAEVRQGLRQDLGKARSGAGALDEALRGLSGEVSRQLEPQDPRQELAGRYGAEAHRELDALRRDLEAVDRLRLRGVGPKEQQALRRLGSEQRNLGDRTEGLAEKLAELMRKSPFAGSELPEKARASRRAMGGAGEKLGEADPFAAVPPENEALEGLSELAKELGGARQQMQQGKGSGGFRAMPRGRGATGGREVDRSRVEIPREAEAKELKSFREEVLKAMRRGRYPKDYEAEVEHYYERLIR
jgi:hypothetical protein